MGAIQLKTKKLRPNDAGVNEHTLQSPALFRSTQAEGQ